MLLSAHAMLGRQVGVILAGVAVRAGLILPLVWGYGVAGAALAALAGTVVEHGLFLAAAARWFGIGPGAVVARCWRPGVAAGVMAGVLWGAGLGWAGADAEAAGVLAAGVGVGAVTYGVVLGGLWLACGRPAGAEADAVAVGRRVVGGVLRRL